MTEFDRIGYVNRIIGIAYANHGVPLDQSELIQSTGLDDGADLITSLVESARIRLRRIFSQQVLLETPLIRKLSFEAFDLSIGIINDQGKDWYLSSPLASFDFTTEEKVGLLPSKGGTIFDIGAHQGVWSMYYCLRDRSTTVYCFEPSIINIEAICINLLLNKVDNLRIIPSAVGVENTNTPGVVAAKDMLVDFVGEKIHVVNFENFACHQVDFAKIDIEGYEFDLLKKFDWFFEFSKHYHLELHIPHLQHRGVDYRQAFEKIPFDEFSVTDWQSGAPVHVDAASNLSGFTTLMLKRNKRQ